MSIFFESIKDPVEEKEVFYNPLILDKEVCFFAFRTEKKNTATRTHTLDMGRVRNVVKVEKRNEKKKKKKLGPHDRRPRFTSSIGKVLTNFESGSMELSSTKELIFQSNPTLCFYVEED